jgi:hypothetical protein
MTMKRGILLALAAMAVGFAIVSPAGAAKRDPYCSSDSSQVALGQSYSVSAVGLPTGGDVNMIVTYPYGTMIGVIPVNSDGTFTTTQSGGSAGTYTYQFVGKVKWPQGTFNQSYATCSVQVGY